MRAPTYPLSFAQERLWFLEQLSPGTATYNIPLVLDLEGLLDRPALERALREIVRRHEPLRTIFPVNGGLPGQEILAAESFDLAFEDLALSLDHDPGTEIGRRVAEEIKRPFDLGRGPIVRAWLARLADRHHVLTLTVHHIAFDGWSMGIFFRELSALYSAYSSDTPSPLPDLPIRYVDFAVSQRERLTEEVFARQMVYWMDQLRPPLPVLALPADRPRPPVQTSRGQRGFASIPEALVTKMRELGRREGATLYMTLLATYAAFLHRLTGQTDLVIGTPVANRTRRELEPLIGFFVNSLALRVQVAGTMTFGRLLAEIRHVAMGAYSNQDLPFARVVEALKPDRDLSRSPVFQTLFSLDNTPRAVGDDVAAGSLLMRRRLVSTETSKVDMTLSIRQGAGGRRAVLETNADLFDRGTGERMLRAYCQLLEQVADHLDTPIARLPFVDHRAQRQTQALVPSAVEPVDKGTHGRLLREWAGRTTTYPRNETVTRLFERQAERTPQATAIVSAEGSWSYRELNERANQLAHLLRGRTPWTTAGADTDVVPAIGVCLERSPDTLVALLAVLKAGGAYVPLDPASPPPRLVALAGRARLRLIVTRGGWAARLAPVGADLLLLDREEPAIANEPRDNPSMGGSAESLAYVLFTSGTTGTPKPVGVPHRAIVRLAYGLPDVPLGEGQTVLHLSPLSFDAATFEIWGPWLHGGRVAVAPPLLITASSIERYAAAHDVTVMWLTSSLFNAVVDEKPEALTSVRHLLTGGETLSVPHVARAMAALPGTRLFNGYGPTEATTFTCCHEITRHDAFGGSSIPIGRPLLNTRVYVLGAEGELLAPGVPGELWIGGDGLALGYLDDPDLTESRFMRDPFVGDSSARMFRSGDRVRFLSDGTLEFLGRLDEQIKLRGLRIEPGEVEAAIIQHPAVRQCAVVAVDAPGLGRALVAFFVPAPVAGAVHAPPSSDLRSFLRERLPEYMVPSRWIAVDALPLLTTGKVDRPALRTRAQTHGADRSAGPSLPHADVETTIAAIWREVLGLADIHASDNFFERGGHSLLAVQVLSRMQAAFGADVGLRAFFEAPTVAGMARAVVQLHAAAGSGGAMGRESPGAGHVDRRPSTHEPSPRPTTLHPPATADQTDIAAGLLDIWRDLLGTNAIGPHDNFFDLGGHSLLATRLAAAVHQRFGVDLPVSTLFINGTIETQTGLLRSATTTDWSPLVPIQPTGTGLPLFLVHGIGGEVISFQLLARHIGGGIPIYGLRADSRAGANRGGLEDVAATYIQAIRAVSPTGPYRIGGYSAGGLIAYEMAQQLHAAGHIVSSLVMLDAPAKDARRKGLSPAALAQLVRNGAYWLIDDDFLRSGWTAQRTRLRTKLKALLAPAPRAGDDQSLAVANIRDRLGLWSMPDRANAYLEHVVRMMGAYEPRPYAGHITVLSARTHGLTFRSDPDLGWEPLAEGGITTRVIPGAHNTILREPLVRQLAAALVESLNRGAR